MYLKNHLRREKVKPVKSAARDWAESIIIAILLALFIRTFFVQAFRIPSGSMRMTLIEGDRLLVDKLAYGPKIPFTHWRLPGYSKPHRGDVIVFLFPEDPTRDFIKRLIAVGGETVEIKNGDIYVDGSLIEEPIIKNVYYYNKGMYGQSSQIVQVPQGMYFVLGDNSASSHDSRFWGFVPEDNLIGKAKLIYWPLDRIRLIK